MNFSKRSPFVKEIMFERVYPTKIILNPDGTINKTIVGEDPEFYDYVKSLIKK